MVLSDGEHSRTRVERTHQMFTVYILRTSGNTLYIGQTDDLNTRLKQHHDKKSKSAKYLLYFTSFELVYTELLKTRSEAMKREWEIKHWSRKKKESLIDGNKDSLKNL
jgi:putative endonuclease